MKRLNNLKKAMKAKHITAKQIGKAIYRSEGSVYDRLNGRIAFSTEDKLIILTKFFSDYPPPVEALFEGEEDIT